MPRRAVFNSLDSGGWELERTQLTFGSGFVIANGRFGGDQPLQGRLALADMPLSLADALTGELGVGGTVSGVVDFAAGANGLPTGEARLVVNNLTRASTLLTSSPLDISLVADLSESLAQMRAVLADQTGAQGRLQARIAGLPQSGALTDRLYRGDLFAQLRYSGAAEALWRLAGIELLDVTGPATVAANVRGTLGNPQVQGSLCRRRPAGAQRADRHRYYGRHRARAVQRIALQPQQLFRHRAQWRERERQRLCRPFRHHRPTRAAHGYPHCRARCRDSRSCQYGRDGHRAAAYHF